MPLINGKQFLTEIKNNEQLRDVPVTIYSTSYEKTNIGETTALGAAYFLQKPNKFDELSGTSSNIIPGNFK